jgi:hypothetical protein
MVLGIVFILGLLCCLIYTVTCAYPAHFRFLPLFSTEACTAGGVSMAPATCDAARAAAYCVGALGCAPAAAHPVCRCAIGVMDNARAASAHTRFASTSLFAAMSWRTMRGGARSTAAWSKGRRRSFSYCPTMRGSHDSASRSSAQKWS